MLGGIGSILTLLLIVPYYIGTVLVIVGWVLTIWAVKDISESVNDKSIFNNALISIVLTIVGAIVFAVVVAATLLSFVGLGNLSSMTPPTVSNSNIVGLVGGIIAGLAVLWIMASVGSFFLWKSYRTISSKLPVGLFGTGALLYFIGSILTIILVGFVLIFIAQILFIIAFFSLPDNPPPGGMPQPSMMGSSPSR
jgi:uncharacterized membrane protein